MRVVIPEKDMSEHTKKVGHLLMSYMEDRWSLSDVVLYLSCISSYRFSAQERLGPSLEASGNSNLSSCDHWSNLELETDNCVDTSLKSGRPSALGCLIKQRINCITYIQYLTPFCNLLLTKSCSTI